MLLFAAFTSHAVRAVAVVLFAWLVALPMATPARAADPGYYVVTIYDDPGAIGVELRYWSVKARSAPHAVLWPELGVSYNSGRWYTALLASAIAGKGTPEELSHLEWQNDFLLTQGQWPVDIAFHTLLAQPHNSTGGPSTLEFGPALQTDFGRTQVNTNLWLERSFGSQASNPMQLKYQWQVRHRWKPWLHVGAQGFGELGTWNDGSERERQSHRAGPALFGKFHLGEIAEVVWQAAVLGGKVGGQRATMFTTRAMLEF